jgi:hypothetical protein
MKPLLLKLRSGAAPDERRATGDDTLGRGMDIALTLVVFLGLGYMLDRWLGLFPLFTISLVVIAAVGAFVRLRYVYEATMARHEAERLAARNARRSKLEDAA